MIEILECELLLKFDDNKRAKFSLRIPRAKKLEEIPAALKEAAQDSIVAFAKEASADIAPLRSQLEQLKAQVAVYEAKEAAAKEAAIAKQKAEVKPHK